MITAVVRYSFIVPLCYLVKKSILTLYPFHCRSSAQSAWLETRCGCTGVALERWNLSKHHQEKPKLLICGNKLESVEINDHQTYVYLLRESAHISLELIVNQRRTTYSALILTESI